jgi:hypothetical protein
VKSSAVKRNQMHVITVDYSHVRSNWVKWMQFTASSLGHRELISLHMPLTLLVFVIFNVPIILNVLLLAFPLFVLNNWVHLQNGVSSSCSLPRTQSPSLEHCLCPGLFTHPVSSSFFCLFLFPIRRSDLSHTLQNAHFNWYSVWLILLYDMLFGMLLVSQTSSSAVQYRDDLDWLRPKFLHLLWDQKSLASQDDGIYWTLLSVCNEWWRLWLPYALLFC